jgi:hypothetical protein
MLFIPKELRYTPDSPYTPYMHFVVPINHSAFLWAVTREGKIVSRHRLSDRAVKEAKKRERKILKDARNNTRIKYFCPIFKEGQ